MGTLSVMTAQVKQLCVCLLCCCVGLWFGLCLCSVAAVCHTVCVNSDALELPAAYGTFSRQQRSVAKPPTSTFHPFPKQGRARWWSLLAPNSKPSTHTSITCCPIAAPVTGGQ